MCGSAYANNCVGGNDIYEVVSCSTTSTSAADATINLCSVFSLSDPSLSEAGQATTSDVACGNNPHYIAQVDAMVDAINALNGGVGFDVRGRQPKRRASTTLLTHTRRTPLVSGSRQAARSRTSSLAGVVAT